MHRRIFGLAVVCLFAATVPQAQDFKLFDRDVQIHGFASQGFVHTNENNWLTMYTSTFGSGEFPAQQRATPIPLARIDR